MKASQLIKELQHIKETYGEDVEVSLQEVKEGGEIVAAYNFFVVPELYDDEGWVVNLRTWPY